MLPKCLGTVSALTHLYHQSFSLPYFLLVKYLPTLRWVRIDFPFSVVFHETQLNAAEFISAKSGARAARAASRLVRNGLRQESTLPKLFIIINGIRDLTKSTERKFPALEGAKLPYSDFW